MAVRGKDLGPVEVFEVDSVRRGPDGVCKDFLAFLDEDPGLKKVSLAPAVSTGGGPRLDTPLCLVNPTVFTWSFSGRMTIDSPK